MSTKALEKKSFKGDRILWAIYLLLISFSIIEVFSASSTLAYKGNMFDPIKHHLFTVILATGAIFLLIKLPRRVLDWLILIFILSVPLVYMAAWSGESINQASRWLKIPGTSFTFQPSEIAKMGLVFLSAELLKKRGNQPVYKYFLTFLALSMLVIFPVLKDNFSTAFLFTCFVFGMGFVVEGPTLRFAKIIGICFGVLLLFVGLYLLLPQEAQKSILPRASVWVSRHQATSAEDELLKYTPEQQDSIKYSISDDNFQEKHAKIAIARGIGIGVMPGNSKQRDFLPQAYSDFIYAIIIEETGLVGGLLLPVLYIFLFFRLSILARRSRSSYHALILLGFGIMYVMQAIMNLCVASGVIPITGQTLPLVSKGGTSFVITGFAYGVLLAISRHIQEDEYEMQLAEQEGRDIHNGFTSAQEGGDGALISFSSSSEDVESAALLDIVDNKENVE